MTLGDFPQLRFALRDIASEMETAKSYLTTLQMLDRGVTFSASFSAQLRSRLITANLKTEKALS